MGWGLWHKECHISFLHSGLEFSDNLDCYTVWYGLQRLDKAAKFLEKAENELRGKFFLPPIQFEIQLLMSSTYNYAF